VEYAKEIDAIESLLKVAFKIVTPIMSVQYRHVVSSPEFHAMKSSVTISGGKGFCGTISQIEVNFSPSTF
jgi:hypothetical protein